MNQYDDKFISLYGHSDNEIDLEGNEPARPDKSANAWTLENVFWVIIFGSSAVGLVGSFYAF